MKDYELTPEQKATLTPEEQKKYDSAIRYCYSEDARGPFGGWADGHDMLKELGWKEVETPCKFSRNRFFVTLEKPERFR